MVRYAAHTSRVTRGSSPRRSLHAVRAGRQKSSPPLRVPFFPLVVVLFFLASLAAVGVFWGAQRRTWDGKTPHNILLVPSTPDGFTGNIFLLQLRPAEQEAAVVALPAELPVTILSGYGEYPLRSIFPLLKIEQKPAPLVRAVLSHALQLPLSQVWATDQRAVLAAVLENDMVENDRAGDQAKRSLMRALWAGLRGEVQTGQSLADRWQAWWWGMQLRPDQIKFISLENLEAWGTRRDALKMDIPAATCAVTVVNSTSVPKVGGAIATALEATGFTVLRVTDDTATQTSSSILMDDTAQANCSQYTNLFLGILPTELVPSPTSDVYQRYRAHIAIIVGNDLATEFAKSRTTQGK